MSARAAAVAIAAVAVLGACGETATLPVDAGTGPMPTLPPPHPTAFPTVDVATAEELEGRRDSRGRPAGTRASTRTRPASTIRAG